MNINKLAATADKLQKSDYSKSAIYNAFEDAIGNDGKFDERDMAKLYAYFQPSIPAKPKKDSHWLAHAMATQDVRYYLNYIYSDGKRLAATDGHRMHVVNTEVPAGFYDKNMNKIDIDGNFPDIDRVTPSTKNKKTIRFSELIPQDYQGDNNNDHFLVYIFDGVICNATYMKQAAQYFKEPIVWFDKAGDAVLIKDEDPDDNKFAVIMPIRH